MEYVFLLHHTISRSDHEDDKIIGIYESKSLAEEAMKRLQNRPGFRDPAGRFTIGPYKLNMDYFADGFGQD